MQNFVAIQAIIAIAVEMIGVDHYAARLEVTIPGAPNCSPVITK
jgi:hypothetical protein